MRYPKAQDFKPANYVEKSLPTLDNDSSIGDPLVIGFAKYVADGGYELSRRIAKGIIPGDKVIEELDNSGIRGLGEQVSRLGENGE